MPCDSTVVGTRFVDSDALLTALKKVGAKITRSGDNMICGSIDKRNFLFSRRSTDEAFAMGGGNLPTDVMTKLNRSYAEIGIRAWAKKAGYLLSDADASKGQFTFLKVGG